MKRSWLLIFGFILLCTLTIGCGGGGGGSDSSSRVFRSTKLTSGTTENLNDIWYNYNQFCVVGNNGTILSSTTSVADQPNGWTLNTSPTDADLYDITGKGDTYYAVGVDSATNKNKILKFNGTIWSLLKEEPTTSGTFYGIDCDDDQVDQLVVVGSEGWGKFIGGGWNFYPLVDIELSKLKINALTEDYVYFSAIGKKEVGIITCNRFGHVNDFQERDNPCNNVKLNDFISEDSLNEDVYVGDQGTILLYNKTTNQWRQVPSGTTENLNGVAYMYFNSSKLELLIVGDNGTIVFYNGASCSKVNSGTSANINAVCAEGLRYYAVGDGGTILQVTW